MHQPIDDPELNLNRVKFFVFTTLTCDHFSTIMRVGYPGDDEMETIYEFTSSGLFHSTLLGTPVDEDLMNELIPVTLSSPYAISVCRGSNKKVEKDLLVAIEVVKSYREIKLRSLDPLVKKLNASIS